MKISLAKIISVRAYLCIDFLMRSHSVQHSTWHICSSNLTLQVACENRLQKLGCTKANVSLQRAEEDLGTMVFRIRIYVHTWMASNAAFSKENEV